MLDVAIIGAGPVGLATAAALLQSLDSGASLYAAQVTEPCFWLMLCQVLCIADIME